MDNLVEVITQNAEGKDLSVLGGTVKLVVDDQIVFVTPEGEISGSDDDADCSAVSNTYHVEIVQPDFLNLGPDITLCEGEQTDLSVNVSMAPPYTYNWSTGENTALITVGEGAYSLNLVDANGCFMKPASSQYIDMYIKDADKHLIQEVKDHGRLIENSRIVHSYPFCWRSQTPLIYRTVASFFVKVTEIKDALLSNNARTRWVPSYVKEKRFHNWLEGAHDWSISRNRYWLCKRKIFY